MSIYDEDFFAGQEAGSGSSARAIAPVLNDLVRPQSVIDVGCGVGHWIAAFKALGVRTAHGIDGPWVSAAQRRIPAEDFFVLDFDRSPPPYAVATRQAKYDLAISLEFLEHIDPRNARPAVDLLCRLSDAVAVGAALPGQGGTHHVNEQWPDYWAGHFKENGFVPCDVMRPIVWNMPDVEFWYAQNLILYFRSNVPEAVMQRAREQFERDLLAPRRLVHPGLLRKKNDLRYNSMPALLSAAAAKVRRGLTKLVARS